MDGEKSEPERPDSRSGRFRRVMTISVAAFVMSVTISLVNAFYALRGAEIFVFKPEGILLYRHGAGDQSVLVAAVRVAMVNTATGRGDVLVSADFRPTAAAPAFPWEASVTPDFHAATEPIPCNPQDCVVSHPSLFVRRLPDEIVDIPAGGPRLRWLTFPLTCSDAAGCRDFGGYQQVLASLRGKKLSAHVKVRFSDDGERDLECISQTPVDTQYIDTFGWTSVECSAARVRGEPFF